MERAAFSRWVVLGLAFCACQESPFREVVISAQPSPTPAPPPAPKRTAEEEKRLRVSVAGMESPSGTYAGYSQLFGELAHRVGAEVDFVQRRTYSEVNELLLTGELDAALLCTGGYLELLRRDPNAVELVGIPIIGHANTYQSLIIVPKENRAQSLQQLAGARFAFTDELSLTGRAWVVHELRTRGQTPERFFSEVTYTRSHDRSVAAVARGVVDGAAVHSIVFQHLLERDPTLLERVRVIQRSPGFGMTPVVVSRRLPEAQRARLREVLLGLAGDPQGARLLAPLRIERFAPAPAGLFDSAYEVVQP